MNIDHELRDALRRREAPRDLAERVLDLARRSSERAEAARIHETPVLAPRPGSAWSRLLHGFGAQGVPRWLAAAAVLAIAAGGAGQYYEQQRAAEAARVREELRIALQITNDALAHVQRKLSPPAWNRSR